MQEKRKGAKCPQNSRGGTCSDNHNPFGGVTYADSTEGERTELRTVPFLADSDQLDLIINAWPLLNEVDRDRILLFIRNALPEFHQAKEVLR